MKRRTKTALTVGGIVILVFGSLLASWIYCEFRWARLNSPSSNFTDVPSYVAHGRLPSRVTRISQGGRTYFIAYGPLDDEWLAVPSGPAAYVFDDSGKLIDWSKDEGDDPAFHRKWSSPENPSSLDELKRIGA